MKTIKYDQVLSGSRIESDSYIPPEITVLEINPEKGFAASSSTDDWGSITW
ncbi:MAG: hypothetical protein PHS38_11925 [Bacteroidales bacterium]|jgi:hypothetical protein|nr:hypothetical protein [Bacteroidales bacterium]